jgi:RimJ/RimL family protein N-acetyltransferase
MTEPTSWIPREPPTIEVDEFLMLDRARPADAATARRLDLDPDTARFFGWTVEQVLAAPPDHYDGDRRVRENIAEWREGRRLSLAIRCRTDGQLVGFVELQPDGDEASVSYVVDPMRRRQGIASRALAAYLAWATQEIGLRRAFLTCHVDNAASRGVAANCDFEFIERDGDDLKFRRDLAYTGDLCTPGRA